MNSFLFDLKMLERKEARVKTVTPPVDLAKIPKVAHCDDPDQAYQQYKDNKSAGGAFIV